MLSIKCRPCMHTNWVFTRSSKRPANCQQM